MANANSGDNITDCSVDIDDFHFIECFKEHECLYNIKLWQYRNRRSKQRAYEDIANKFQITIGKCIYF